jgi:hypothetical protein
MPEYDLEKIDEVIMALLYLNVSKGGPDAMRAWKSFDWDAMDRLYEKGYISDPKSKAKSVLFSEEGMNRAADLFEKYFG